VSIYLINTMEVLPRPCHQPVHSMRDVRNVFPRIRPEICESVCETLWFPRGNTGV